MPERHRGELLGVFADDMRDKLLAYAGSPLFAYHRGRGVPAPVTPAVVLDLPSYRVEGGWAFLPRVHNSPSDGWAFAPRRPTKGRHDAFCLGGVVICPA